MEKIIFATLFLVLASVNCYAQSGCGTQTECKDKKNAKGELDGEQVCVNFYKKNLILKKANYKAGKLDGDFFCANDDGVPVQQAHYKMGELDGLNKEYDSSLKTWALEENYKMGKREGLSKRQTSNGQIIKLFKNDQQYGYEINVDKSGKLVSKLGCKVEGVRKEPEVCNAIAIPGYEKLLAGHVLAEKDKIKPVPEKETVENKFKNGKPQSQMFYEKGQKVEEKTYFEEGQIQSDVLFKKGFWPYKRTEYYQNGKLKTEVLETEAGGTLTNVDFKLYYDSGKLESKGRRKVDERSEWGSGVYDGEIQFFSKDGAPTELENYNDGKRIGTWKTFGKKCDYETTYDNDHPVRQTTFAKGAHDVLIQTDFMPDGSKKSETMKPGTSDHFCD